MDYRIKEIPPLQTPWQKTASSAALLQRFFGRKIGKTEKFQPINNFFLHYNKHGHYRDCGKNGEFQSQLKIFCFAMFSLISLFVVVTENLSALFIHMRQIWEKLRISFRACILYIFQVLKDLGSAGILERNLAPSGILTFYTCGFPSCTASIQLRSVNRVMSPYAGVYDPAIPTYTR